MMWFVWLVVSLAGFMFALVATFLASVYAKRLMEEGVELNLFWRIFVYPLAGLFVVLDFTIDKMMMPILMDIQWEWMLSSRVTRHVHESKGWPKKVADWWKRQINQVWPRHIK